MKRQILNSNDGGINMPEWLRMHFVEKNPLKRQKHEVLNDHVINICLH